MFLNKNNSIRWKLLVVATCVVSVLIWAGIAWFDKPLFLAMRDYNCNVFSHPGAMVMGGHWGCWLWVMLGILCDAAVWIGGCAFLLLLFYIKKARHDTPKIRNSKHYINLWVILRDAFDKVKNSYVFYVFCSVLSVSIIVKVLKIMIGRMRPVFFEAQDITGFFPFVNDWAFNSMPSGHAAASFAGFVMIGMLSPKFKWLTWTVAIVIGVSRCIIGAHWPTDVILGAFLGMVVADFVKYGIKKYLINQNEK